MIPTERLNPNTGKGWTDAEERAFAEIMAASRLSRLEAIRLWKRCRKDTAKAVRLAKGNYPKPGEAKLSALRKAWAARKGTIVHAET
jgi:head-tail adaptor